MKSSKSFQNPNVTTFWSVECIDYPTNMKQRKKTDQDKITTDLDNLIFHLI